MAASQNKKRAAIITTIHHVEHGARASNELTTKTRR
jgi:hypothetical protein